MNTDTLEPDVAVPPESPQREELFPEEEGETLNTMDVTRKIHAVRRIEMLIAQYQKQDTESRQFYADRKAAAQARIDFVKGNIRAFLHLHDLQRLQTPNGTAYFRSITLKQWPADEVLLAWAQAHLPEAIRLRREPDKKAIGEHIKTTGDTPEGYYESEETRLYLR
jgi:hypothetical protein